MVDARCARSSVRKSDRNAFAARCAVRAQAFLERFRATRTGVAEVHDACCGR